MCVIDASIALFCSSGTLCRAGLRWHLLVPSPRWTYSTQGVSPHLRSFLESSCNHHGWHHPVHCRDGRCHAGGTRHLGFSGVALHLGTGRPAGAPHHEPTFVLRALRNSDDFGRAAVQHLLVAPSHRAVRSIAGDSVGGRRAARALLSSRSAVAANHAALDDAAQSSTDIRCISASGSSDNAGRCRCGRESHD